jgi:hypothetical protein
LLALELLGFSAAALGQVCPGGNCRHMYEERAPSSGFNPYGSGGVAPGYSPGPAPAQSYGGGAPPGYGWNPGGPFVQSMPPASTACVTPIGACPMVQQVGTPCACFDNAGNGYSGVAQ